MIQQYQALTDSQKNADIAEKVTAGGNYQAQVLTYLPNTGWIHNAAMMDDGYLDNDSKLVNLDKYLEHTKLVGAGGKGLSKNSVFSKKYETILEEAAKQRSLIESNPGINPAQLLGAAATGNNLIETEYETVRKVNYLTGVVGKQYQLADYNARMAVNERRVNVLNVVGFRKSSSLLQGLPEIGDHTTPPPFKQAFATYNASLYADSFRYEFGMREKRDSAFDLVGQIIAEIPGIFARMKDDKITTLFNAASDDGAYSEDWDDKGTTAGFYDADAASDVETDEANLDQYGSDELHMVAPRAVIRAYLRNIQEVGVGSMERTPDSLNPEGRRNGILPANPEVTYHVNTSMTAKSYVITAKQSYADLLLGPVVNVSYKNQMTPAQTEGRITFDFNEVVSKDTSAIRRHTSVLN